MKTETKHKISELLKTRMDGLKMSQDVAAKTISNMSGATVNMIVNKKWVEKEQIISDKMWNRVAAYLGMEREWVLVVEDRNFKRITNIAKRAQQTCHAKAISGEPGLGKSATLKEYSNNNPNAYYIQCAEFWTKKVFLQKLRQAMGMSNEGVQSIPVMVDEIVTSLHGATKPLIIIDEADKLKDGVISLFNCLYNEAPDACGFLIAGAPFLKARIEKGVRQNKQSYKELFSRVGGEFLTIHSLTDERIATICHANGLNEPLHIQEVINTANNDLRRVKNTIDRIKLEIEKKVK